MVSSLSVPQATQITEKWSMRKALKTITTGVIAEVAGGGGGVEHGMYHHVKEGFLTSLAVAE